MPVESLKITAFIEAELGLVRDARILAHIREQQIAPEAVTGDWDYGIPGQTYPCWIVANTSSDTGIAYCEQGFGPTTPWGLIFLDDARDNVGIGMDSGWFRTFFEAWCESFGCTDLPSWRVFTGQSVDGDDYHPVTQEDTWESAWQIVKSLRDENPGVRYGVDADEHVRIRQLKASMARPRQD